MQSAISRNLKVRNLPEEVWSANEREKRRPETSLNRTVIDLLRQSLWARSNGLARLGGIWTEAEHRRFLDQLQVFEKIDQD